MITNPFPVSEVHVVEHEIAEHDWSTFAVRGGTEPAIPCVERVQASEEDDVETLRDIRAALEFCERAFDVDECIDSCTNPTRRSEFPAAEKVECDEDEIEGGAW